MLAEELKQRLMLWNTECTVAPNPEFQQWLAKHYPQWKLGDEFSQLSVKTIDPSEMNMLWKGDYCYICWFSPEGVMNTGPDFIADGLLTVGADPSGDMLVIDTRADDPLTIGFISHSRLWEDEVSPREAYRPLETRLLDFLDQMDALPDATFFYRIR